MFGRQEGVAVKRQRMERSLPSWREGPAKRSLISFLREVTRGRDELPVEQRVAAFDLDGTLVCENPRTMLAEFLLDQGGAANADSVGRAAAGGGHDVLRELGVVFAGRTVVDYDEAARGFLARALHPRFGCSYPSLAYQPMLELMALLGALQFSVFVCTDSSRDFVRVMAEPLFGLRREKIVGSEVRIESIRGALVRTAKPVPFDDGPGKTVHLWDRAGTQPLLAAGNAAGDVAMLSAARYGLVLRHDDEVREYAYDDRETLAAAAIEQWTVVSMRRDFIKVWEAVPPRGAL